MYPEKYARSVVLIKPINNGPLDAFNAPATVGWFESKTPLIKNLIVEPDLDTATWVHWFSVIDAVLSKFAAVPLL